MSTIQPDLDFGRRPGVVNWHWKNKDCTKWSKSWFQTELLYLSFGDSVKITSVEEVDGDCEVGMRKSKVITVYDFRIRLKFEGTDDAGEAVTGDISSPEVAHDMAPEDYKFEISQTTGSSKTWDAFRRDKINNGLIGVIRSKFDNFPKILLETHGSTMISDGSHITTSVSGDATPIPQPVNSASTLSTSALASQLPATPVPTAPKKAGKINTASVKASGTFQVTAEDLWGFLTDDKKVPLWTRNAAVIGPEAGAEISLFGGNITGKMVEAEPPKRFVSTWRAPTWPEGHFGVLTTTLDQSSDSTTLTLKLDGVPIGNEEETERNLDAFYIRGLKQIGLGTIL